MFQLGLNEHFKYCSSYFDEMNFDIQAKAFNFLLTVEKSPRHVYQISNLYQHLFLKASNPSFLIFSLFLSKQNHVHVDDLKLLDVIFLGLVSCSCFRIK